MQFVRCGPRVFRVEHGQSPAGASASVGMAGWRRSRACAVVDAGRESVRPRACTSDELNPTYPEAIPKSPGDSATLAARVMALGLIGAAKIRPGVFEDGTRTKKSAS